MSDLSPERLGKLTASMAPTIMSGPKGVEGLEKYVRRLAGERLYGDLEEDTYRSAYMERGNEVEPRALDWYEFHTDTFVERGPFIVHPTMPYCAATPDAIIRGERTIEAKSPSFHVWSETKESREVPSRYLWQVRWQMWCAQLTQCHFVVWHPKARPQGVIVEFKLDTASVQQMQERAMRVEMMIREKMEQLA